MLQKIRSLHYYSSYVVMESSQKTKVKKHTWVEWTSEMNQTFDEGACAGLKAKKFFNRNLKSDLPITLELGTFDRTLICQ